MVYASLLLAAAFALAAEPVLLVRPYLQPGPKPMVGPTDDMRLIWLTEPTDASFKVEYGPVGGPTAVAKVERTEFTFPSATNRLGLKLEGPQRFTRFIAALDGLPTNQEYAYVVKSGDKVLAQKTAKTRVTSDRPTRFVMVGDLADGKSAQNRIAYAIHGEKPDFLVALGDIVYPSGRNYHYTKNYWPTYVNADKADPEDGAPLMTTMPFYAVLGNHDTLVGRLSPTLPDAWAAYYFFTAPQNGPGEGPWSTEVPKSAQGAEFRRQAGSSYPALGFYSFDYGPAHITVIDNSGNGKTDDPKAVEWLRKDLAATKQPWKFVCLHMPPFHINPDHYAAQRQRRLAPLFEAQGVDVVFSGHVHNYQRSKPLRFAPAAVQPAAKPEPATKSDDAASIPRTPPSYVNGAFAFDENYDGVTQTRPKGVIYVVEGGGGAGLYKGSLEKLLAKLPNGGRDNFAPFNAKYHDKTHSFALIELTPRRFELRALDDDGVEIDRFAIEK
jgi:predicted phosphodiesterase